MKKLLSIISFGFLPLLATTQTIAKINIFPLFDAPYSNFVPLAFGVEHYLFPKYSVHAGINKQNIYGGGGLTRNGVLYYRNEMHGTKFTLEFRRYTKSFEQRKFGSFFVGAYGRIILADLERSGIAAIPNETDRLIYGVGFNLGGQFNYGNFVLELLFGAATNYGHNFETLNNPQNDPTSSVFISPFDEDEMFRSLIRLEISVGYSF